MRSPSTQRVTVMVPRDIEKRHGNDYKYYRGMKLRFNGKGQIYWRTAKSHNVVIEVASGLEEVYEELIKLKPETGSFRITGSREVLTKLKGENSEIFDEPKFVCMAHKEIEFKAYKGGIEHNPVTLEPGDLWTGIYDGTRFSFSPGIEPKIWWRMTEDFSVRYMLELEENPLLPNEIISELHRWKPTGGVFCVTIDGHVLTMIDKRMRVEKHLLQGKKLTYDQLELLDVKERSTGMFPIYIGTIDTSNMFSFTPPRRFGHPITKERKAFLIDKILGGNGEGRISTNLVPKNAEKEIDVFELIPTEMDPQVLEMEESELRIEEE